MSDRVKASDEGRVLFEERLTSPVSWWIITVFIALSFGLVALRFQGIAGLIGGLASTVVAFAVMASVVVAYGRVRVRVTGTVLEAGTARIPLVALGRADPLDAEAARALRGPESDMRAFMLLRSYVRTAVRVDVTDPTDRTPYLFLSTRRADELATALNATRAPLSHP